MFHMPRALLACRRPGLFLASSLTMSTSNSPLLFFLAPFPHRLGIFRVSGLRLKKVLDKQPVNLRASVCVQGIGFAVCNYMCSV